jgi:hypothetical protein
MGNGEEGDSCAALHNGGAFVPGPGAKFRSRRAPLARRNDDLARCFSDLQAKTLPQ